MHVHWSGAPSSQTPKRHTCISLAFHWTPAPTCRNKTVSQVFFFPPLHLSYLSCHCLAVALLLLFSKRSFLCSLKMAGSQKGWTEGQIIVGDVLEGDKWRLEESRSDGAERYGSQSSEDKHATCPSWRLTRNSLSCGKSLQSGDSLSIKVRILPEWHTAHSAASFLMYPVKSC